MDIGKIIKEVLEEKKRDRCLRIADRKYDKPSAYKSGAVVKCRKGKIWKDLKESKQVGPLYHYTSAKGLKGILSSNRINASEEYYLGNDLYYISFTRNKNFHNKGSKFGVKTDYRITLDGDKLSNRYKISPFAYKPGWNYKDNWEYDWLEDEPESVVRDFFNNTGDYDEQEERISFRGPEGGIDDVKNYILAVDKVENLQEEESIHQKALSQTEKEALEITYKNWDKFGGKECNNGFCDIFAKNLSKYLPGSKIMSTEDPRNNTLGHVWIEYNGKYFDAETPKGVNSWKQLPWMKEFFAKTNSYPTDIETLNEDESLHKWFSRRGAKGSTSGWIDCNAPDGKGGYKSCGRQKGEKRSKYPACRRTPAACKDKGKGKTWGKKAAKKK